MDNQDQVFAGTSATTFAPNAGVTGGQNVTFAKCYDDNIVQPALAADLSTNATGITASASAVARHRHALRRHRQRITRRTYWP